MLPLAERRKHWAQEKVDRVQAQRGPYEVTCHHHEGGGCRVALSDRTALWEGRPHEFKPTSPMAFDALFREHPDGAVEAWMHERGISFDDKTRAFWLTQHESFEFMLRFG